MTNVCDRQPTWFHRVSGAVGAAFAILWFISPVLAQQDDGRRDAPRVRRYYTTDKIKPNAQTQAKVAALVAEIIEPEISLDLDQFRSKLIRTNERVSRFSITDPNIVEVDQVSPYEFELIGGEAGHTTLTLWFDNGNGQQDILRYLIRVSDEQSSLGLRELEYRELQDRVNEMFPDSVIQFVPIADKLIIRGQARDAREAAEIMALIRGEATLPAGQPLESVTSADEADSGIEEVILPPGYEDLQPINVPDANIIDLLNVPGEMQVLLKVRIAELSRTAAREMAADLEIDAGDFAFSSLLGGADGAVQAILDTDEVMLTLSALSTNSYSKVLAEPNLVTLSGQPASFIAGGQFAVPTVVGVGGVGAVATTFRNFGAQLTFLPTVIDKDRIRLRVSPSLSSLNGDNDVDGIPGLNIRAVSTTVDLREGQWLAIAGLIQDRQDGSKSRVPFVGDIPILDAIFSEKTVNRGETELIILVSPELVHPLEPEQMPLILPGMEVTEPGDWDFYALGHYEGRPGCDHRSTVWPLRRHRITESQTDAVRAAKYGGQFIESENYYVHGPSGFSE